MEELPYNHAGYPEDPGADGRTDQAGAASEEDISRATLCSVEKGSPSVSIGGYAAVLHALNGMDRVLT